MCHFIANICTVNYFPLPDLWLSSTEVLWDSPATDQPASATWSYCDQSYYQVLSHQFIMDSGLQSSHNLSLRLLNILSCFTSFFSFFDFLLFPIDQCWSKWPEEDSLLWHRCWSGWSSQESNEWIPAVHSQSARDCISWQQGQTTSFICEKELLVLTNHI